MTATFVEPDKVFFMRTEVPCTQALTSEVDIVKNDVS
jgi:hypothetical protein